MSNRRRSRKLALAGTLQRMRNEAEAAERERRGLGWWGVFSPAHSGAAMLRAQWHRYRLRVIGDLMTKPERASAIRSIRVALDEMRTCDRPRLP